MQISYNSKPHSKVDYFPLPNGMADVFLRKNEREGTDEEGNTIYIADEVYFQIDQSVTKQMIEENFNYMWNDAEKPKIEKPTIEERLEALEIMELERLFGGM